MRVKATREGLLGRVTATGFVIDNYMPFVALPATRALYKFVRLYNPLNAREAVAIVLDVGPWNTDDDEYVFGDQRPQAETGVDKRGRPTNGAGIDLSFALWRLLGMHDNTMVEWEFLG